MGYAPGTATFYTSVDGGVSFQQLGDVVTGLSQKGLAGGGNINAAIGTINAGNVMFGRVYSVTMKNSGGTVLYGPNMKTLTVGQTGTFQGTGVTPATWTINGPILCDMPPRATTYARLKAGASYKVKSLEISPTTDGNWGTLWSNYSSTDFASRIQWAKDQGANCVKWTCSGSRLSYSKYPSAAVLETNIADVCATLRAKGMKLYLSLAQSDEIVAPDGTGRVARVADLVTNAKLWMKYGADVILGADLCNEVQFGFSPAAANLSNGGRATTWGPSSATVTPNAAFAGDMAYYHQQMRTVMPDVPLSFSMYMSQKSDITNGAFLMSQATLGMQFHDYHPYNGTNGQASGSPALASGATPAAADLAGLEGQPWFLGAHTIGECGMQRRYSAGDKQAMFGGLIAQATSLKSLGWVGGFIDYDFTSGNEPGDYGIRNDATLTASFAGMAVGAVVP